MGSDEDIFPQEYFVYFKKNGKVRAHIYRKMPKQFICSLLKQNKERRRGV